MKLIELLETKSEFDCELVTEDYETNHSFNWDEDSFISEKAKQKFSKLLQSEVIFKNGNIILTDNSITEEELLERQQKNHGTMSSNILKTMQMSS